MHKAFYNTNFTKKRRRIINKNQILTQEISINESNNIIKNLSNGTACGPDNIPNEILKYMNETQEFQQIINKLLNTCLHQQKIPTIWKKSNIFTIFKKGNPNIPLNYRPIALLCTTYKLYSYKVHIHYVQIFVQGNIFNFQNGSHFFSISPCPSFFGRITFDVKVAAPSTPPPEKNILLLGNKGPPLPHHTYCAGLDFQDKIKATLNTKMPPATF